MSAARTKKISQLLMLFSSALALIVTMQNCGGFAPGTSSADPYAGPTTATVATANQYRTPTMAFESGRACGISSFGAVGCRGSNDSGEFGDGTLSSAVDTVAIPSISSGATYVSSILTYYNAAIVGGHLVYFGIATTAGQLTTSTSAVTTAVAVSRANYIRLADGTLVLPSTSTSSTVTVATNIVQVESSQDTTCALTATGAVYCFGGQFSFPTLAQGANRATVKTLIPGFESNVVMIGVGLSSLCGLFNTGAIECLGNNDYGQLGTGTSTSAYSSPVTLQFASSVKGLVMTDYSGCAVLSSGSAQCWGGVLNPAFGIGSSIFNLPVVIPGLSGLNKLDAVNYEGFCATLAGGLIKCFGIDSATTKLGYETLATDGHTLTDLTNFAPGTYCGLDSNHHAICRGYYGVIPDLSALEPISQLTTNYLTGCVLKTDQTIRCWSSDSSTGVTTIDSHLRSVAGISALYSGSTANLACALLSPSTDMHCWAYNSSTNTSADFAIAGPVIPNNSKLVDCFATTAGTQRCFNTAGATTTTPFTGLPLSTSTQVALWSDGGCSLSSAGAVSCWGSNAYGQLGNGSTTSSSTPVAVPGLSSGVTQIAVGLNTDIGQEEVSVCAVLASGHAKCWGSNNNGNLGTKIRTSGLVTTPTDFTDATDLSKIELNGVGGCALRTSGAAFCWGYMPAGDISPGGLLNFKPFY